MYSSEYTSGFSGPAASHLAAPPSPRHEGNVGQAPSAMIPVVEIGIQRTGKIHNLTVDAAQVNPALEEVQKWVSC
jgi:hypothetical protein